MQGHQQNARDRSRIQSQKVSSTTVSVQRNKLAAGSVDGIDKGKWWTPPPKGGDHRLMCQRQAATTSHEARINNVMTKGNVQKRGKIEVRNRYQEEGVVFAEKQCEIPFIRKQSLIYDTPAPREEESRFHKYKPVKHYLKTRMPWP